MCTTPATTTTGEDALALLAADHKAVQTLFREFQKLVERQGSSNEKAAVAQRICDELSVHALLEEEIFYPAVRAAIEGEDLIDETRVERATVRNLIDQLRDMEPGEHFYDATVSVLGEYVDHHVEEDEEMFCKTRQAALDMRTLGQQMAERKEELRRSSAG
jgi:hypothetical protein